MTDVRGITGVNPAELTSAKVRWIEKPPETAAIVDKVEISTASTKAAEVAAYSELAKAVPEVRIDLVEQARERVANGTYLKPEVTRDVARKIAESL